LSPSGTASVEITAYIDCVPETNEHTEFTEDHLGLVLDLPSYRLNLNPQRMFLDPSHQQDFGLLLFSYLKGIGTGDALTFRMHDQGQGQSI
jgi:hypothetical protein